MSLKYGGKQTRRCEWHLPDPTTRGVKNGVRQYSRGGCGALFPQTGGRLVRMVEKFHLDFRNLRERRIG